MTGHAPDTGERALRWDRTAESYVEGGDGTGVGRKKFVKGPIPLEWLECAAKQPGQALTVGVAIWYLAGLTKSNTVRLSNRVLAGFGVERDAKRRAIRALESGGLIAVSRGDGRSPVITIISRRL